MTFLNAWAAGFAAIAPLIVLLYLLKLKRRPVAVSTLLFWQRLLQENRPRALFQRLRQWLSLLLHLLIFALILGALAHPVWDQRIHDGTSSVIIIDTRARMAAIEPDGQTRLARAKVAAGNLLRQASPARQMAVLSLDAGARVIAAFTDDQKLLGESLARLTPTDAGGALSDAIDLAGELLASRDGPGKIVVFTDRTPNEKTPGIKAPLEFVAVGSGRENVAITGFAARPLLNSPQTSEVFLEVANFGGSAAKIDVEMAYDGRLLDVKPLSIEAGARARQIFPAVPRPPNRARGLLTARLASKDALATDNTAYAVLPAEPPKRILLVTKGNWFIEKLLAAEQTLSFELVNPDAFTPILGRTFDAVILDNYLPAHFDLEHEQGNFLFLKRSPFNSDGPELPQPLVSDVETEQPVLRLVHLQNVTLARAAALALPKIASWTWRAPIRSFDHPLLITGERHGGNQRVAALAIDITDSDLPLRVAFPLLISNTLHWLAGEATAPVLTMRAGETLALAADETVESKPQFPGMAAAPAHPMFVRDFFQPLVNGFYRWQTPQGTRWLAVNTFRDVESGLRAAGAPSAPIIAAPAVSLTTTIAAWPLWQYLAAAALFLLAWEWWLFHRRRTE